MTLLKEKSRPAPPIEGAGKSGSHSWGASPGTTLASKNQAGFRVGFCGFDFRPQARLQTLGLNFHRQLQEAHCLDGRGRVNRRVFQGLSSIRLRARRWGWQRSPPWRWRRHFRAQDVVDEGVGVIDVLRVFGDMTMLSITSSRRPWRQHFDFPCRPWLLRRGAWRCSGRRRSPAPYRSSHWPVR